MIFAIRQIWLYLNIYDEPRKLFMAKIRYICIIFNKYDMVNHYILFRITHG